MQIHITLVMIMFILVVTAYVKPFGGEQSEPLLLLELGSLLVTFLALWSGSIFNDYPKCQDPLQGEGITLPWCDALSLIVGALIILYIIVVIVKVGASIARIQQEADRLHSEGISFYAGIYE